MIEEILENKEMQTDFLALLNYIPILMDGLDYEDDNFIDIINQLDIDSEKCLAYYPDLDRGKKSHDYLIDIYNRSGDMNMNYFAIRIEDKDDKTIIALLNMMFATNNRNNNNNTLINAVVWGGTLLKWLKRLREILWNNSIGSSSFECPVIGQVHPKGSVIKYRKDGTGYVVEPSKNQSIK